MHKLENYVYLNKKASKLDKCTHIISCKYAHIISCKRTHIIHKM
jgi:hypothetical protein